MFTSEQIKAAHSNVRSGADFPAYIQDLKRLGVTCYEIFVKDGYAEYYGANDYKLATPSRYEPLEIAKTSDEGQFKKDLLAHQKGKTDYAAFCRDAAKSGVEKWVVCMEKMTCTYYDTTGHEILVEEILH